MGFMAWVVQEDCSVCTTVVSQVQHQPHSMEQTQAVLQVDTERGAEALLDWSSLEVCTSRCARGVAGRKRGKKPLVRQQPQSSTG